MKPMPEMKTMAAVPVTLRLTREQLETAERLASKSGIRCQTLLKRVISDGLRSMERAARLKNWQ
jgi:predicted DNA binding CopG/RHH family protein